MNIEDFVPQIINHSYLKCAPDWRIRSGVVNSHDITYVIKGAARYTVNGTTYDLRPGDLLCLNKGSKKAAVSYPKYLLHCYETSFQPKYPQLKKSDNENLFPVVSHIGLRQDVIDLFKDLTICWNEQQKGYTMKSHALFMLILNRLAEIIIYNVDADSGDYRINKITRYITTHYSEKLNVNDLADQVHLNPDYFGQLFKRETGMVVHQYITKVRIQNAETLLQSGGYKIYEAANHCGFSDVYYFYKTFKALRGFPPSHCIPKSKK